MSEQNLENGILKKIESQIKANSVILYMKGSPVLPQCGFSARVSYILRKMSVKFSYVDILKYPEIRANLPKFSEWPTFPQLFVEAELVGGCDIICEMYETGELQELFNNLK